MPESLLHASKRRIIYLALLAALSAVLMLLALVAPFLRDYFSPALEAGQVVEQEYRAPRAITYESQVLTAQRRDAAERAIMPIYTPPDMYVARQQLEHLRNALAFITSVRADQYASHAQKLDDMAALEDVYANLGLMNAILGLTDARWQTVQQEALAALEEVMSTTIRPEAVEEARSRIPALVSLSLSESQAMIVAQLAAAFVAPNSEYSEGLTADAREAARNAVQPVTRSYASGQMVVRRGEVVNDADIEALQQLGLAQPQQRWQDLVSAAGLALLAIVFMMIYAGRRQRFLGEDLRSAVSIALLFQVFLLSARLAIPAHTVIPYIFPIAAYSMTVAALFGAELAIVSSAPLAILVAYGLPNALDLTPYYMIGGLFGVLALGRARRLFTFFWAGAAVALSSAIVILVYRLPSPTSDLTGLATLAGAALFNGLASASITVLLQFLLAQLLGVTTSIQLIDLTRPDHPLLQILLRDAPGTYQHSLQVANLAEQAAERIGADPLLTRVGALYHDIGKTANPVFFIENQPPGFANPHDTLPPRESAAIIIRHVADGLELGRKYRLPRRILDFMGEHHGTAIARYQYVKAVKAAGGDESQVDIEQFRYPGLRPQSRETAVLMLADGSEARVRSERPLEQELLRTIIKEVIEARVSSGQLDDTDLTLRDLSAILDSFTATLRGIYHPRVIYPKLEQAESPDYIAEFLPQQADSTTEPLVDAS
ncbi:MAG: HDIG domain-containing protein [Anaerolineales bacterium]|nr:HDIG domain-containing protein [Anaerolineales bacterium]